MPADVTPSALPDSRPLFTLIGRTRRLLRSSWIATGLGVSAGLLLGTLAVLAALDLLVPLELALGSWAVTIDPGLRLAGLLLIVVPAALAFLQGVVRPMLRRLGPTQVARRIEAQMPGIHNRLVSAVEFQVPRSRVGLPEASPVFLRRLLTEALDRIKGFRASRVVDFLSLRRAAILAGVSVCAFVLASVLFSERMPTAMARLFLPFADIPPASGVAYEVQPGQADVLRDEEVVFSARVKRGDPASLRIELQGERGSKARQYDLKPDRNDPNTWKTRVDVSSLGAGFEKGFRYRVFGGGTWSKRYAINLVERPVLVGVDTSVYYPKYMRIPEPFPTPPQAVEVTGPEGGQVEAVVRAQGEVAAGDIQLLVRDHQPIPRDRQQERAWFEEKIPVGATAGGSWNWQTVEKRTVHTEPAALGTHAHWFQGDPAGQAVGKGDVLFAYVQLVSGQSPETIMLEWHDGDGWEHRAYWGADRIREGKPGTPSRFDAGELPAAGQWVRLEVPAAKVGLEGKTLRGLAFKLHGGQCYWGRVGTVQIEEPSVRVVKRLPMKAAGEDRWVGRFPLVGRGLFRAELRNTQGHPNKPMKELRYVALPDKPPYVALERQGSELVLSKAATVQLTIAAFDDYGLDEVALLVREGASGEFKRRTLRRPAKPPRNINLVAALGEAGKLPLGGQLRYAVEARDTKGQTARTPEYTVRIANDANAADKQFEIFDKTQDTFTEQLAKLIGEQAKVQQSIEKLNKEYAQLTDSIRERQEAAQAEVEGKIDPKTGKPQAAPQVKLSPEEAKRLAELQHELAKLAGEEKRNADMAKQIGEDFKKAVEQAEKLQMMPQAVANEMKGVQNAFDKLVAKALQDLQKLMAEGADPKKGAPDVKDLKDRADRVDKEMRAMKDRLDALSKARKGLREDLQKALAELRQQMLKEDGKLTARDLEQLRDYINKMREQLAKMKGRQDDLRKDAENDQDLAKAKKKQEDLEKQLDKLLADAKKLLEKKRRKRDADDPEFPDAPYRAEGKEETTPPREEDSDEPLPEKKGKKGAKDKDKEAGDKAGDKKDKKDDDDEDEEKKFMPRLGGPRQKLDPRFAKKRRPVKRTPKDSTKPGESEDRDKLADRQDDSSRDLDAVEKSLDSDANTLEKMIDQLNKMAQGKGKGEPKDGDSDPLDQLRQMMQSPSLREAMRMAAQARALGRQRGQQGQRGNTPNPSANQNDTGREEGGDDPPVKLDTDLANLEPGLRAMILKMPKSRTREELIRGLNERGPEAYRAFIEDYFKRLTQTKPAPKK
jgi:hypothetical protein